MDESESTNDKTIFTISFLTLLLALSSFKESLSNINFVIFSHIFSLFQILAGTSIPLFFSVYLSALDKLRYNYFNLVKIKLLDNAIYAADFFYFIAILVIPGFIIMVYILSCFISFINFIFSGTNFSNYLNELTSSLIISLIASFLSSLFANVIFKSIQTAKKEAKIKSMEESNSREADSIAKASKAYEDNRYYYTIIFLSKAIEDTIYSKLAEKRTLNIKLLSFSSMLELAILDGILTKDQTELIKEIKSLRNKIIHGTTMPPLSEEYVKELVNKTKYLFNKETS